MSTKRTPGPFDCYDKLELDEPYFVLRAKDAVAPEVVEHWIKLRTLQPGNVGNPKLAEARQCAKEMRRWRERRGRESRAPTPVSTQPCGCDPGAGHHCERWPACAYGKATT